MVMQAATRFRSIFYRLRWKLTSSYTVITTLSLVVTFILLGALIAWRSTALVSEATLTALPLEKYVPVASIYFDHGNVDRQGLTGWTRATYSSTYMKISGGFLAVVDLHAQIVATAGSGTLPTSATLVHQLGFSSYNKLQQILRVRSQSAAPVGINTPAGEQAVLLPIINGDDHTLQGVLIWKPERNILNEFISSQFSSIVFSILIGLIACVFIIIFIVVGTIFGFFTARGFTRRLEKLSSVVASWSRGDFQHVIVDTSKDEIGQVAQQLNTMAQQLQDVFSSQQKLAILEERNRLARELHDSVKQQVFSASMQLSTADSLLERDAVVAQKHIHSAEMLIEQVQRELASVIHELRPLSLERQSLAEALTTYVREWEQQTGIVADLHLDATSALPAAVETACYRTCQEALSNVARHSGAQIVVIRLQRVHDLLTLGIVDNGHGFNPKHTREAGLGLQSMRERAEELHGFIEIESARKSGTAVAVTYPLSLMSA